MKEETTKKNIRFPVCQRPLLFMLLGRNYQLTFIITIHTVQIQQIIRTEYLNSFFFYHLSYTAIVLTIVHSPSYTKNGKLVICLSESV
jgi:fucose permease